MRSDINHLPHGKQRELDRVVEMLFQGFRETTQNATGPRKSARILKVILFGSYARGDWVDAVTDANEYKSDYDILVIVNQKEAADRADHWEVAEQRLVNAYLYEKTIRTPVNFIVHSLQEVNDQLAHGRVFFGEIVKDGAMLYESDDRPLATLKPKTPLQAYETAKEYFEDHFTDAMRGFEGAQFFRSKSYLKKAAFELHQAVEQLYQGVLLTLTFYTPYDHNILFLRDLAEQREPRLFDVWARGTRMERATYQKLKEAYRKGRYSKHYQISEEEIAWLSERIEILGQRMHDICSEHVARLAEAAGIEA